VQASVIEAFKNPAHRVFEMHEINPVFRVSQRAGLVVGVAKCGPTWVEPVEFDDPLPDGRGDLLAVTGYTAISSP
jgi:hypothetical protein